MDSFHLHLRRADRVWLSQLENVQMISFFRGSKGRRQAAQAAVMDDSEAAKGLLDQALAG